MALHTLAAKHFAAQTLIPLYKVGTLIGPQLSTLRTFAPYHFRSHHFRPVTLAGKPPQPQPFTLTYARFSSRSQSAVIRTTTPSARVGSRSLVATITHIEYAPPEGS